MSESLLSAMPLDVRVDVGPFSVRVRSDIRGVADHLALLYPDFPQHSPAEGHFDVAVVSGRGVHRVVRRQARAVLNGSEPFFPVPQELAGPSMEWGLNWCIGTRAHHWVVVHSAVVERGGRALIMPAPPGSGKSTLCAALAYSGWRLFSDEFALIDPDTGLVHPAPRPISLKNASIGIIHRRHPEVVFSPERVDIEGARFIHARPATESVRRAREQAVPAWLILPKYVAGSPTILEPLPRARALVQLADESFNYNFLGPRGFTCLADLIRRMDCYRLEYSDLDDVLARLARLGAD